MESLDRFTSNTSFSDVRYSLPRSLPIAQALKQQLTSHNSKAILFKVSKISYIIQLVKCYFNSPSSAHFMSRC